MTANPGASQEAILYHYDVGNDFYAPWLGPTMVYSAAILPDDRRTPCTLEEAQAVKMDWHLESCGLSAGGKGRPLPGFLPVLRRQSEARRRPIATFM